MPKPAWLAQTETLWPRWRLDGDELSEAKIGATRIAVAEQTRAGIDCVTDGEQSRVHFVLIELAGSRVPAHVLGGLRDKDVAVGVIDVASDVIETPAGVRGTLESAARYVAPERLIASTNCGMAPMNRGIAYAKLAALGRGAKTWRTAA